MKAGTGTNGEPDGRPVPGRWYTFFLAVLAGALMTAGQPPVSIPWAHFLAVPALIWLMDRAPGSGRAALIGWGAGFGYFVSGLHWIGHAFLVDPDRFAWMMPFAVTLLPAGLALFWATAFALARRWWSSSGVLSILGLAALWTLTEYARSRVLTGFPWALPGYVWSETPVAQAASWIGPHGLTLVTLVLTPLPLLALLRRVPRVAGIAAVTVLAGLWIAGTLRLPDATAYVADAPVLRLVQPNATQKLKWDPEYRPVFFRRQLDYSAAPADPAFGPPDVVIWPETAVPFLPDEEPALRAQIADAASGATVVLGALDRVDLAHRTAWQNSLMVLGQGGEIVDRYAKHHLVPFGEYLPLPGLLRALGLRQLAEQGGFAPGPGPRSLKVPGLPRFVPLICYEMIFPDEVTPPGPRADWLLQITNDAWFGSFAGPQQHLAQARFRAIETGLPVVRVANTGISAVIDPFGRTVASIPLNTDGSIDARLPSRETAPLYANSSDSLALAACLALLVLLTRVQQSASRD